MKSLLRGTLLALPFLLFLLPSQASAQGAGVLTPSQNGYVWTRGQLRFELISRHATWGPYEIMHVQQSLDRLPDVLLQHAMDMQVTKLHRDDVPRKRLGLKSKNASATTVVDAGSISFGDILFTFSPAQIYRTVTHEFGHVAQYSITGKAVTGAVIDVLARGTPIFSNVSWLSPLLSGIRSHNGFVSNYAKKNVREDFAESVEFYWINPDELLRVSPDKFNFIRDRVFNQLSSPASSRDLSARALGPAVPRITQLGKTRGGFLSFVKIKGELFMGILDGGFNRVRYGGKKALHLPVSRSTIFSWVPKAPAKGSAPVTVETQDATSAPAPFEKK